MQTAYLRIGIAPRLLRKSLCVIRGHRLHGDIRESPTRSTTARWPLWTSSTIISPITPAGTTSKMRLHLGQNTAFGYHLRTLPKLLEDFGRCLWLGQKTGDSSVSLVLLKPTRFLSIGQGIHILLKFRA
jgi:hypothetical protein